MGESEIVRKPVILCLAHALSVWMCGTGSFIRNALYPQESRYGGY